ncbi:lipopolysaccharide biosynthesis protein [Ideonella sp. DXS22W]|uniref:Lipopolysaccharide biosynthesis protein n=1 Tax=Pseudaquabacterium inlustre TaxID=2984192 RepID=A0ABU9CDD1_9BURK
MSPYLKNMAAMLGQSSVQRIAGMLSTMVMARCLGSAGFGLYSIAFNTGSTAYSMLRLGVDAALHVQTAQPLDSDAARQTTSRLLGAGFLLLSSAGALGAAGLVLAADTLATALYGRSDVAVYLRIGGVLVLLQCMAQFAYVVMMGLHRFKQYAAFSALNSIGLSAVLSTAAWLGDVHWALGGLVGMQVLALWIARIQVTHALHANQVHIDFADIRLNVVRLLRLGFPFYAAGLLTAPIAYLLQASLTKSVGLDAMGGMRVITSLTTLIGFVPNAVAAVMISHLTRARGVDPQDFAAGAIYNIKVLWSLSLLACVAMFAILPWLVTVLFGHAYSSYVVAAGLASFSALAGCVIGVVINVALSSHRVDIIVKASFFQAITWYASGWLLIDRLGLTAYYVAEALGSTAALAVAFWLSRGWRLRHGFSLDRFATLIATSATFAVLVLWPLGTQPSTVATGRLPISLLLFVAIGCALYRMDGDLRDGVKAFMETRSLRKPR